jgi:ATP-binding cassette, subfamily B, bacterial
MISVNRLLRPHWKALAVAFVAVIVDGTADLFGPWPIKIALDYVVGSRPLPAWAAGPVIATFGEGKWAILRFATTAALSISALGAIASYTESYLTTRVGQWIMHDLRQELYHHIQGLSLSYYDRHKTGDLIGRLTNDVDAIQSFVSSSLLDMAVDVLTLGGMMAVMFYFNWHFTLIALAVAPLLFLEVYTLTSRIKQAARAVRLKEGDVMSVVQETLSSIRVVKAFAREDYEERRLEKETLESIAMTMRARRVKAMLSPTADFIVAAGACLALWYGAGLALKGALTAGSLVVFLLYLGKLYKPMRDLSKMTDSVSKALIGAERIKDIIKSEEQTRDSPRARRAPRFKGEIEFKHVFFSYRDNRPVLRDLSFHVRPGEFAAFVGPTGAGKTTIISLIPRFYSQSAGRVLIDGQDIRDFTMKSLRRQLSFVLQETALFRAPLWQNIAYGKPDATREEIVRASRLANAHEFIGQLPEGYETTVGERGMTLSGGQRQRIAIARAIIRDSPILILDEPTSGLDSSSEKLVIEALERLMEGRTTIMIAHHLESVRRANSIFVLEHGRIVESGKHPELLARNGLYAQLYQNQFRDEDAAKAPAAS